MAITYRTRKFSIPLRVNKVREEVEIELASLDLDGETIALRDVADNGVVTLEFEDSSDTFDGSTLGNGNIAVGIKNAGTAAEMNRRVSVAYAGSQSPDTLIVGYKSDKLSIKQTIHGDVITAVVSDAAKLVITEIAAGSDGNANPDINAGAATLSVDSSNLGFNPALDTLKLQVNCNDYKGDGSGEFDVSVRPAGSEIYALASENNIAGADVVIIGGQSNSIVFDGVKLDLTGVTAADAAIYLTFISEEAK
jgi:hypothetical protein